MASLRVLIWDLSWDPSLVVTEQEMTGRGTPHARPSACLEDEDIGHVLVLGEEGEVEEDLEGLGVGGEDHELGDAAVEGLGGLVRALLELLVVLRDGDAERRRERVRQAAKKDAGDRARID